MRCSTVTPGKFATFWRRPVRRLNSVDFPEFGGPMIATTWGRTVWRVGGGAVATAHPAQLGQSLMALMPGGAFSTADGELIVMRSRAGARLRIHLRDIRAVLILARFEPEPPCGRGENRVP